MRACAMRRSLCPSVCAGTRLTALSLDAGQGRAAHPRCIRRQRWRGPRLDAAMMVSHLQLTMTQPTSQSAVPGLLPLQRRASPPTRMDSRSNQPRAVGHCSPRPCGVHCSPKRMAVPTLCGSVAHGGCDRELRLPRSAPSCNLSAAQAISSGFAIARNTQRTCFDNPCGRC